MAGPEVIQSTADVALSKGVVVAHLHRQPTATEGVGMKGGTEASLANNIDLPCVCVCQGGNCQGLTL
jgi:hypothetical protein